MQNIYRGNLVYTPTPEQFVTVERGVLAVEDGKVRYAGPADGCPAECLRWDETDYGHRLLIPGFVDLHLHAPQFRNMGLGTDMQLLPWLETYTFPEEARFADTAYGERIYKALINRLWEEGTTRSVLFASIHLESTRLLADLMIRSGLSAYVGKVNMDRNAPDYYIEDTRQSLKDTEAFILEYLDRSPLVKPIVTPRFVPSCTSELMEGLGKLADRYNVPVQSHLDENPAEIDWVCQLHPESENYCGVYNQYDLLGSQPTVMAHCIYCTGDELALIRENRVTAVHCPHSNANIISGIMPVKDYMDQGIRVGLGSDISGGHELAMPRVMVLAMQLSKILAVFRDDKSRFLSTAEAFYLGTKAGGSFFGQVGSFEEGYEADFLVINDDPVLREGRSLEERISQYLYLGTAANIEDRYVAGNKITKPFDSL